MFDQNSFLSIALYAIYRGEYSRLFDRDLCDLSRLSHYDLRHSRYTILQILSVSIFEKTPVLQAISRMDPTNQPVQPCKKLQLCDL